MARKRKPNWGPILWLATTVNVAVGLAFSPVTAVARVRVVGALDSDRPRVTQAIQLLKNKPALRAGAERALEEVYRRPDVHSAQWSQNLFRRGLLELRYDAPVARLKGREKTVLTTSGQIAQTQEPIDQLPELAPFDLSLEPSVAFGTPYEGVKIADVCFRAATLGIANLSISVQANGAVCLNSGSTGRVLLGSPDDLDEKVEKLQEILSKQPNVLAEQKEIVLMVPSRGMVRPLGAP